MAASRAEPSPLILSFRANQVAILHCNAGRPGECAEFANKASTHAAAASAGETRSKMLATIGVTQAEALILQGKAQEAEALAAQFLIEPVCCEHGLHRVRAWL